MDAAAWISEIDYFVLKFQRKCMKLNIFYQNVCNLYSVGKCEEKTKFAKMALENEFIF